MRPNEQRKGIKNFSFIFSLYHFFFSENSFVKIPTTCFIWQKKNLSKFSCVINSRLKTPRIQMNIFSRVNLWGESRFMSILALTKMSSEEKFSRFESSRVELSWVVLNIIHTPHSIPFSRWLLCLLAMYDYN